MGHYSELYFSNTRSRPKRGEFSADSPHLLSKYHVPLLWLALFEPRDIVLIAQEEDDDRWPYLVKTRTEALQLLASREQAIVTRFPSLKREWLAQFKALLERSPFEYVHLDTSDVGSMVCSGEEWHSKLQSMLSIFSNEPSSPQPSFLGKLLRRPSAIDGWAIFNSMLGPAFEGEAGEKPWPYCGGSGTNELMPWETEP
jgi:hypothetical protein